MIRQPDITHGPLLHDGSGKRYTIRTEPHRRGKRHRLGKAGLGIAAAGEVDAYVSPDLAPRCSVVRSGHNDGPSALRRGRVDLAQDHIHMVDFGRRGAFDVELYPRMIAGNIGPRHHSLVEKRLALGLWQDAANARRS